MARMIDRWDWLGAAGVALVGTGVAAQFGWPWASMFLGALAIAVYVVHEMAAARRPKETR